MLVLSLILGTIEDNDDNQAQSIAQLGNPDKRAEVPDASQGNLSVSTLTSLTRRESNPLFQGR